MLPLPGVFSAAGVASGMASLGAIMIIAAGHETAFPARVQLIWQPLRYLGLWSYSLYLWHWAILVVVLQMLGRQLVLPESIALITLTVALSAGLWRFVERPARRAALRDSHVLGLGAGTGLVLAVLAFTLTSYSGLGQRSQIIVDRMAGYIEARNPLRPLCHVGDCSDWSVDTCALGVPGDRAPDVVLIGDSHADHWAPGLDLVLEQRNLSGVQWSGSSCIPIIDVVIDLNDRVLDGCTTMMANIVGQLDQWRAPRTVVLAARWSAYFEGGQFVENEEPEVFLGLQNEVTDTLEASQNAFREGLSRTVERLTDQGHRVIVLGQAPEFADSQNDCVVQALLDAAPINCGPSHDAILQRVGPGNAAVESVVIRHGAHFINPTDLLCDIEACQLVRDGVYLYFDDDHLNAEEAKLITPELFLGLALQ